MKKILLLLLMSLPLYGCTVVSANRAFPKLDWYWSKDAKAQRESKFHSIPSGISPASKLPKTPEPEFPPYIPPYPGQKPNE
jgi:hypothetical protein